MTTVVTSSHCLPAGQACSRRRATVVPVPSNADRVPPSMPKSARRRQRREKLSTAIIDLPPTTRATQAGHCVAVLALHAAAGGADAAPLAEAARRRPVRMGRAKPQQHLRFDG